MKPGNDFGSLLHYSKQCVSQAALGHSDHVMIHLILAYRQKLKLCKPVVRTSKQWTVKQWRTFGCAWTVLTGMFSRLLPTESTEAVMSYISFCEDSCVPSCARASFNNDKPWFITKFRQLRLQKEEAFRSGDKDRFKEAKYRFSKEVREVKRLYFERLQHQLSKNNADSVWNGLRQITNDKLKAPRSINHLRLANNTNQFYCRFDRQ